jgi:hypothetical protein
LLYYSIKYCIAVKEFVGTSLLSDSEKDALEAVMDDIHATFARDITVFKFPERTVITTDSDFNPYYKTGGATSSIENIPVSGTYSARIYYVDDVTKKFWSEQNSKSVLKTDVPVGTVRIKVAADAYEFIKTAQRVDLDDRRFVLDSVLRGHGLFTTKYYTFYLKPDP